MEAEETIDLDRLAKELSDKMRVNDQSLRDAAEEIGCSAATLSRLLKGSKAENLPDTKSLLRTVSWLDKSLSDFELSRAPSATSMTDVELHLRALPGITETDKKALVAMVRAAHDEFRTRSKKG
jgi:transcriptional regulator with XRE-family HTH domain